MEAYKYIINNLSSQLGMNSTKVENGIGDMNSVLYGVSKKCKTNIDTIYDEKFVKLWRD